MTGKREDEMLIIVVKGRETRWEVDCCVLVQDLRRKTHFYLFATFSFYFPITTTTETQTSKLNK